MAKLRLLTAGESHGPKLTGIIEGLPAGFAIDKKLIDLDLERRQQGFGRGGRMKIERDQATLTSGVVGGKTTGGPVALDIANIDYKNWRDKDIAPMATPRPGHADFAGALKYDHDDLRLTLERASARETAMRTAMGSLCKQILAEFGIKIFAYVTAIGTIRADLDQAIDAKDYEALRLASAGNQFSFADEGKLSLIEAEIRAAMEAKDTLGGVFTTIAMGLPPGLGSYVHYDRRLDGIIAQAMMSIPAMKAVEIGCGIENAKKRGTDVHDEFTLDGQRIARKSNRAGGLEGGVTNGMPVVVHTYMKPISTTLTPRTSINLATNEESLTVYERSDFCAVPRACVIGEAMLAVVLLDAMMDKIGGDSRADMLNSFKALKKGRLAELSLKNAPWRFNYDQG